MQYYLLGIRRNSDGSYEVHHESSDGQKREPVTDSDSIVWVPGEMAAWFPEGVSPEEALEMLKEKRKSNGLDRLKLIVDEMEKVQELELPEHLKPSPKLTWAVVTIATADAVFHSLEQVLVKHLGDNYNSEAIAEHVVKRWKKGGQWDEESQTLRYLEARCKTSSYQEVTDHEAKVLKKHLPVVDVFDGDLPSQVDGAKHNSDKPLNINHKGATMNPIFKNKSELELIEAYAEAMDGISSEEELSEVFDQDVENSTLNTDDKPYLRQEFNDWKDEMEREGYIHPLQANKYCYVGELFDN